MIGGIHRPFPISIKILTHIQLWAVSRQALKQAQAQPPPSLGLPPDSLPRSMGQASLLRIPHSATRQPDNRLWWRRKSFGVSLL
jgi:hypothetical protein